MQLATRSLTTATMVAFTDAQAGTFGYDTGPELIA